jgi:polar amino acid transport system permease protein
MEKIIQSFFNLNVWNETYLWLLTGLKYTVVLTLISMATSLIIGLFAALGRVSQIKIINTVVGVYINVFRGTPLLIQLIILFFALPYLGVQLDRWPTAILALTLNNGAYVAEYIRGGIQSVETGQTEAAKSLGMNYMQRMIFVILPQAFKQALPSLVNSFVSLLKDTAQTSVIGVEELLKQGRAMQSMTANATPLMSVAVIYLLITLPMIFFIGRLEKKLRVIR